MNKLPLTSQQLREDTTWKFVVKSLSHSISVNLLLTVTDHSMEKSHGNVFVLKSGKPPEIESKTIYFSRFNKYLSRYTFGKKILTHFFWLWPHIKAVTLNEVNCSRSPVYCINLCDRSGGLILPYICLRKGLCFHLGHRRPHCVVIGYQHPSEPLTYCELGWPLCTWQGSEQQLIQELNVDDDYRSG